MSDWLFTVLNNSIGATHVDEDILVSQRIPDLVHPVAVT